MFTWLVCVLTGEAWGIIYFEQYSLGCGQA